jgi:hypothetical protein
MVHLMPFWARLQCENETICDLLLSFYFEQKSRAALQRYLFYCNRYMNHMASLKFENKVSWFYLIALGDEVGQKG